MTILPGSYHIEIQGKPGRLETFIIKIMRNITKKILKINNFDEVAAPTSVPASLIDGKTHVRSLKIPVSSKKIQPYHKYCYTRFRSKQAMA